MHAVGSHQPVGDVTEIVGVATLPTARRRGLGAAVTAAVVDDARRGGAASCSCRRAAPPRDVYARLGFTRIGTAGSPARPCQAEPVTSVLGRRVPSLSRAP